MSKSLTAVAIAVGLASALAMVAGARPVTGMQRVSIAHQGDSFVLRPTSPGPIEADHGTVTFCCWTSRSVVRAGTKLDVNDPLVTLVGTNGTLKLRNEIVWVDVPGSWSVFTGTWKVVGGTGAYARLSGHGSAAGVKTADSSDRAQFFGFLGRR